MKVYQLAPNQVIVNENDTRVTFVSYKSTIAIFDAGVLTLGADWDYSKTTAKYLHMFIKDYCPKFYQYHSADKIRRAIAEGVIKYDPDLK